MSPSDETPLLSTSAPESGPASSFVEGASGLSWRLRWTPSLFRTLTMTAQIATVVITWPLWQVRQSPPLLPLVLLPQCDMAWPMILSAVTVIALPRTGLLLHALVMLIAMLQDQTRMQPEFVSLWLLALATLRTAGARLVGRAHLASLWFYSGFHKLLSAGYYERTVPWLFAGMLPAELRDQAHIVGTAAAWLEITLGVLAVIPQTRRLAAVIALPFHLSVVARLADLRWNYSVWPWNVVLAISGFALLWDHRDAPWRAWAAARWPGRVAAMTLLISPAFYYLGLIDGYMAHCLYSSNVPRAHIEWQPDYIDLSSSTWDALQVPLPPVERVFRQFFAAVGKEGDLLVIEDPRWCARALWHNDCVEVRWDTTDPNKSPAADPR